MATMVKEKRREKKKVKEKHASRNSSERELSPISAPIFEKSTDEPSFSAAASQNLEKVLQNSEKESEEVLKTTDISITTTIEELPSSSVSKKYVSELSDENKTKKLIQTHNEALETNTAIIREQTAALEGAETLSASHSCTENAYQFLSSKLEKMTLPKLDPEFNVQEFENRLDAMLPLQKDESTIIEKHNEETKEEIVVKQKEMIVENVMPSAPMMEEDKEVHCYAQREEFVVEAPPKVQSMPLEEAVMLFGGKEMAEVRAMSEREEAIVEAGPTTSPEHPLLDLLATFRTSLIAVERERIQLAKGFADEEKFRNTLWKVEKRNISLSEDCPCGAKVDLSATYEHAELLKDRLPVAKMKLEGLLRDVQDSYCHHQHAALLAHCQIEELISETIKSNKNVIREALALVLQALKMSDNAPTALASALQRWARALSAALLDARDLRQLLHLLHHLFRQTRSVRWAARVLRSQTISSFGSDPATCLALLELLLAKTRLEPARECTEDADESWEEMDERGEAGAVSEGALRERDLLALLRALPLRSLVARLVHIHSSDITLARERDWGDNPRELLKSSSGTRALLAVLQRGMTSHPTYTRLHAELRSLAATALHALAGLHLHARDTYSKEFESKIRAELEACFASGLELLKPNDLHQLPTNLLDNDVAREYCTAFMVGLHDTRERSLKDLPIQIPAISCRGKVKVVTQAAIDRIHDNELARTVLEFLFQTGIRKKAAACKGTCNVKAKELISKLLREHSYLHTTAFHILADLNQVEVLDPSCIAPLSVFTWRPTPGEIKQVLEDYSKRCPNFLQNLLLNLDYRQTGLSLETQLTIGSWLCHNYKGDKAPEWAWTVLRNLRVHRTFWGFHDAPSPDPIPSDLFSNAFAVLASSWGHCIPLICSEGVTALCKIANARPADAIHCLGPVMVLMADSPESVSLTPKFTELFNILLKSGPTIVQRALGLGPIPGADLVLKLILEQIERNDRKISKTSLVSAWLHALWRPVLNAFTQLDTLLLATREWQIFDEHISQLLQEKDAMEHLNSAVRNVSSAPLLCEVVLRNAHAVREVRTGLFPRLLDVLHLQRIAGDRIHVDNALKQIGAKMSSEDLVIYKMATALLSVPPQRTVHLTLWSTFFYLYLQRPPNSQTDATPPVGPLFFSGLIKSRTLAQLRKKLQEMVTHHHNERENLERNCQEERPQVPPRSKRIKDKVLEEGVVPVLTQKDFTGDSSDSSDNESDYEESDTETEETSDSLDKKKDLDLLIKYHLHAEAMFIQFLRFFDEGERTMAMPLNTNVAIFVEEQVLAAAWSRELESRRPSVLQEDVLPPSVYPVPPKTPFQMTVDRILEIKDCSRKRSSVNIRSMLEDVDFKDARSLLALVDKYLANISALAEEWYNETARIMSLDLALWDLVCSLRVKRNLPSVKKQCPQKCRRPVTIHIPYQEWCISSGAEKGIGENRRSAKVLIRRLARARPHAAFSAAALTTIARQIRSTESAIQIAERAWQHARLVQNCSLAQTALTSLVEIVADRWLCHDGVACSNLLKRWGKSCNTPLQESLCGLLVNPRRLIPAQWPDVYKAVLSSKLPSQRVFSYLSKFEMARWSAADDQRQDMLDALLFAAQKWGPNPAAEHHVLLELIGVHTSALLNARLFSGHVCTLARACVALTAPPALWPHATRTARSVHAQLGQLLRELGVIWWEARTKPKSTKNFPYAIYAPYIAEFLQVVQRAFVASNVELSYAPERVAVNAWSSLQESWSPWVAPHSTPSLVDPENYTHILNKFVECIQQVMLDCPGTEGPLLQFTFEWTIQVYFASNQGSQDVRNQLSTLLEELKALPWAQYQWFRPSCLQYAMQVCASGVWEIQAWCASCWRELTADTWLGPALDQQPSTLACLFQLYTAMAQHKHTLAQAARLPWWRLPQLALEEALDRYFQRHYDTAHPYHELPHFRMVIYASELSPSCLPPGGVGSRGKRCGAISRWVCASCSPALASHVPAATTTLLNVATELAPYLESSENELEELLCRALAVMCMEPAATSALPVWQQWVQSTNMKMVLACIKAASLITAFEYFAALTDAAIRAYLRHTECTGWTVVYDRLKYSPWHEAGSLCGRGRLYIAHALLCTFPHHAEARRCVFAALLNAKINFKEHETIIALWICTICRYWLECNTIVGGANDTPNKDDDKMGGACDERGGATEMGGVVEERGVAAECAAAAAAVIARWGTEPRQSLLQLVTLRTDYEVPTPQHRLLCRLAQCIVSNSEINIRAYETLCSSLLGPNSDAHCWAKAPCPKLLPRLAIRLFPTAEKFFQEELALASNS